MAVSAVLVRVLWRMRGVRVRAVVRVRVLETISVAMALAVQALVSRRGVMGHDRRVAP